MVDGQMYSEDSCSEPRAPDIKKSGNTGSISLFEDPVKTFFSNSDSIGSSHWVSRQSELTELNSYEVSGFTGYISTVASSPNLVAADKCCPSGSTSNIPVRD